jgi:glutathione peroxidase-family protein
VGRDGQIVERFSPHIPPLDPRLVEKIEALLATKPVVIPGG